MQQPTIRGADILARALTRLGVDRVFSLSGNHIMPLYDALLDTPIDIIHVRHEAACVHMADAYARLTGQVGIALVTGGQGHTNGAAALFTARSSEAPMILLSGHAGLGELGQGAFQELRQADYAAPVTKASWTVQAAAELGHDLARAMQIARSGRPGPVHLSLPVDLLEKTVAAADHLLPGESDACAVGRPLAARKAVQILKEINGSARPLVLCGPALCGAQGRGSMAQLEDALRAPVIGMESPRGINDPGLGAFSEVLAQADLIVLLGKPLDFTLRFGNAPFIHPDCRWLVVDPDRALLARAATRQQERVGLTALADPYSAMAGLLARRPATTRSDAWLNEVKAALAYRPLDWQSVASPSGGPVHPLELCNALQAFCMCHAHTTLVCDGGEIGQWPQAVVTAASRRLINGVAGTIGPALPFALAAKLADPAQHVVAVMGDGTFGFHMAEFDTAVRYGLAVIVVVGNDARWNAEYQIQLRDYGKQRALGCELLPARYDKVVEALGGHGEYVTKAADLAAALERAAASGKPACLNVVLESVPAPVIRRAVAKRT